MKLIINFYVSKGKYTLYRTTKCAKKSQELNVRFVVCNLHFLCKQKQKKSLPSKWKKYCTADLSIFSKTEMNRLYSASESDIDGLKQASSSRNTKKLTLSWMRVFNNWKITHSYTEEMLTYQPEYLNLILETFYAKLNFGKLTRLIMNQHL